METKKRLGNFVFGCLALGISTLLGCDPPGAPSAVASPALTASPTPRPSPTLTPPSRRTSPSPSVPRQLSWLRVWFQTDCSASPGNCPGQFGFGALVQGRYFFGPEETAPAGALRTEERAEISRLASQLLKQDLTQMNCIQINLTDEPATQARITMQSPSGFVSLLFYSIDLEEGRKCYRGSLPLAEELLAMMDQVAADHQGKGAPSPSPSPAPSPRARTSA